MFKLKLAHKDASAAYPTFIIEVHLKMRPHALLVALIGVADCALVVCTRLKSSSQPS